MAPAESAGEPEPQPHLRGVQTAPGGRRGAAGLAAGDGGGAGAGAGGRLEQGAATARGGLQSLPEPGETRT